MHVTRFDLLLVGTDIAASPATDKAFRAASARVPVIDLGNEFATLEAGEAAQGLLDKIAACLQPSGNA
jgi:hypothetical protein